MHLKCQLTKNSSMPCRCNGQCCPKAAVTFSLNGLYCNSCTMLGWTGGQLGHCLGVTFLAAAESGPCWMLTSVQCSVTLTSSTFSRLHTAAHRTLRTLGKIIVCIYINKYTRGLFPLFPSEEMRWDIMLVTFMMIRKAILCLTDQMSHQLIIHIRCREINILRYTFLYLGSDIEAKQLTWEIGYRVTLLQYTVTLTHFINYLSFDERRHLAYIVTCHVTAHVLSELRHVPKHWPLRLPRL